MSSRLAGERRPSQLAEWISVLEIASTGVAATLVAHRLGLQRVDMLMALYFSITFSGQFLATMLGKMAPFAADRPGAGGSD
jgi:hypothetical protein